MSDSDASVHSGASCKSSSSDESNSELQYLVEVLRDTVHEIRRVRSNVRRRMLSHPIADSDILKFVNDAVDCSLAFESEKLARWTEAGEIYQKSITVDWTDRLREEAEDIMHNLDEAYAKIMAEERREETENMPTLKEIRETMRSDMAIYEELRQDLEMSNNMDSKSE